MALVTFRPGFVSNSLPRTAFGLLLPLLLLLASCGGSQPPGPENRGGTLPPLPPPASSSSSAEAAAKPADPRPVIVAFGDSLSAGHGLERGLSYPDFLQKRIDEAGLQYRVVNQGLSGDTTTGGLSRLDQCLALKPKLVLLELGGNDGLRGVPVESTRRNLDEIITRLKAAGATVVLAGITLPRNYGDEYIRGFEKNYKELAAKHQLKLIPFLMDGLFTADGAKPGMIQEDGIHPTAKGTPVMADTVFRSIRELLRS